MKAWGITAGIAASLALSTVVRAQQGVALEKVTFERENQAATQLARKMYQPEFSYVSAQRIWLREPAEGAIDQVAVKLGFGPNCQRDCRVAVLYHTNGEWAEVWRGGGKTVALGQISELTGLKSIFADNREWTWGGAKYEPSLYGGYPPRRAANEAEMRLAVEWLNANVPDVAGTADAPKIEALDVDLMNGDETLVFLQGVSVCGNAECPVLAVDDGKVLHQFWAIGSDAGIADGRTDQAGYRLIEVQTAQDISVVSPSTGEVTQHIRPQEVIAAGTPREEVPQ